MSVVLLENLPSSFSEATLKSIISHVQAKGNVLASSLVPDGETMAAHVHFERGDDAEAAVRLWDQLTIDGATIQASSEADTKRRLARNVSAQQNGGQRYPLAPMNIGWLFEFVNGLKNPEKGFTMCRLLESLMCCAVGTSDPFIEHAVVHFYTKFTCTGWSKAQGLMADGVSFELCRQVFEVIGLIRRYPSANPKSRAMLLTLVERVVDDISKVPITTKAAQVNKVIPEICDSVRTSIAAMRNEDNPDPDKSLLALTSWLKFLFSCLSSHHNQVPTFPESQTVAPCGEHCPCGPRFRQMFPIFLSDVEKVKVIDVLVVAAGMDHDEEVGSIARDLLQRYNLDYCTRAVTHVQNGDICIVRLHLFEAVALLKRLQTTANPALEQSQRQLDLVEITLSMMEQACATRQCLRSLLSLVHNGFGNLTDLRGATNANMIGQLTYALQFAVNQLFQAICTQQSLLLCVHPASEVNAPPRTLGKGGVAPGTGAKAALAKATAAAAAANEAAVREVAAASAKTVPAGGAAPVATAEVAVAATEKKVKRNARCGNPACQITGAEANAELLKCSACKATYYCSPSCQRADWKEHRKICGLQAKSPVSPVSDV